MSKIVKGSFELMKQLNIAAILDVVRENGRLSRADIAKLTGLTPASVTNITKFLMDSGYLIEKGIGESNGGRPPIILELDMNSRYIIAISIGVGKIDVAITNLAAEIIINQSIVVNDENLNKEYIFVELVKLINKVISLSEINKDKILGIGVAMHGVVNAVSGLSEYAPYYKWTKVNIKEELEGKLGYKVFVDNDVRAMALGESRFGVTKGIGNFITINVSNGVGAGIIIENKPYYGVDYSAGEIGHIVVDVDGDKCNCGNYGCLETVAANNNIVKNIIKLIKRGESTSLIEIRDDIEKIELRDVCIEAVKGDELSIFILKETAKYIGIAVANLVSILNPTEIVLVGEIFEYSNHAKNAIENIVQRRGLKVSSENLKIVKSELGNTAAIIGAATLVIEKAFDGIEFL